MDDTLYRQAKARAAQTGRTVSEVIEDAVRSSFEWRRWQGEDPVVPALPAFGGSGTLPGVDLSDSDRLRDVMDEGEGLGALR